MAATTTTTTSGGSDHQIWGTLEELLLACAVSRHGTRSWDSVAVELQSRIPSSSAVTPLACRQRYLALHRRFTSNSDDDDSPPPPPDPAWLDDLRRLRVAELRREVERSDVSIVSLQSKVRRLREERERSLTVGGGDSDLKPADRISGGSCKESNSAVKADPAAEAAAGGEEKGGGGGEGSCNGSSEAAGAGLRSGESASEEVEREKESSDVQSSASLSRGRRRRRRRSGGSSGGEGGKGDVESQPLVRVMEMIRSKEYGTVFERRLESQGSARYRSLIRRHMDLEMLRAKVGRGAYGSTAEFFRDLLLLCTNAIVFYPRDSPESSAAVRLRSLVSREMSRHEHEWKPPPPPSAAQPAAKESTPPLPVPASKPKPGPDSKMPAPKPKLEPEIKMPVPLIACKKRSFISAKPSSAAPPPLLVVAKEEKDEKKPDVVRMEQEGDENQIPVLAPKKTGGTRGLRTNKSRARSGVAIAKAPNLAPPLAPIPTPVPAEITQPQQSKAQKKSGTGSGGATANTGMSMAKKRGAATFLSRLNERSPTSPPSSTLLESLKGSSSKGSEQKKGDGKKVQGSRPRPTAAIKTEQAAPGKRSVGRPPKRAAPPLVPPPAKKAKEAAPAKPPPPSSRKKGRK